MGRVVGLAIEPLDVLFFRDGRPFGPGERGVGGLPTPQVVAGALRTHLWSRLGIDFKAMAKGLGAGEPVEVAAAAALPGSARWAAGVAFRGPWLAQASSDREETPRPYLPVPADVRGIKGVKAKVVRLRPSSKAPPGWVAPREGMVPLWHRDAGPLEGVSGYLTMRGLEKYLAGGAPAGDDSGGAPADMCAADALFVWEDRTGIAIDEATGVARDQHLFSVRFLRLKRDVVLYEEIELPVGAPADAMAGLGGPIPLGGEGRRAVVRILDRPVAWPKAPAGASLLLLATPGIFGGEPAWLPDAPGLPRLAAAAVPGSTPISGWNLALNRPRPTRNAVVTGSAYFFDGEPRTAGPGPFVAAGSDAAATALGYGLALKGVWKHDES
jgi:CRISPR-associated protein Cmr3